ncbi:MAG: DUF1957 domain-containing protein [Fibrobacter sp.]|jgi:1,4-alpha-glucan branching enzyme|nr:DUF1957 domain-containing protein [Fibrobacter sp.]
MLSKEKAKLLLVLHAHLPFVREPRHERFFEENWLFEAITETYIPLIQTLRRMNEKGIPGTLNLSISPPLLHMFSDALLIKRYTKHLQQLLILSEKELERAKSDRAVLEVARFYNSRLRSISYIWSEIRADLISAFAALEKTGKLNLFTCVGTHPFLPAYQSDLGSIRFQLALTVKAFEKAFGQKPKGLWIPECGYFDGLDALIQESGFEYFFLETHGVLLARPSPEYGVYQPLRTTAGTVCIGRDQSSSAEVWSRKDGYPGHPEYREFFRDIAFERGRDYLGDYFYAGENPIETGFKYYRITGEESKKIYEPWRAFNLTATHAARFLSHREATAAKLSPLMKETETPWISCPYDAELFGHWWFEGPQFIEALFEKAAASSYLEMASAAGMPGAASRKKRYVPAFSSWGEGGFGSVWINSETEWIYPLYYQMRSCFRECRSEKKLSAASKELLAQMAREIALFMASDFAFLIHNQSSKDYAEARLREHYNSFMILYHAFRDGETASKEVKEIMEKDNIFPWLQEKEYRLLF